MGTGRSTLTVRAAGTRRGAGHRARRLVGITVVVALGVAGLTGIAPTPAGAAAGDLDTSFGTSGVSLQGPASPPGPNFAAGVAIADGQGRILRGGSDPGINGNRDSVLARLTADGQPDTTFNGGATGIEFDAFNGAADDRITGLAVHPVTGAIYVAASRGPGGNPVDGFIRVTRLDADGVGPYAVREFGPGMVDGQLAFSNGRLVLASTYSTAGGSDFDGVYLAAMDATTLAADNTFASDGDTVASAGGLRAVFQAMAADASGRILAGAHQGAGTSGAHLFRLNPDGSPDATFGGDGHVLVQVSGDDWITSIAPNSDGRVAVAGRAFPNSHVSLLDGAGNFVASFDGDGRRPLPGAVWTVAWDPAGRLLYGEEFDGVVGRLLVDGSDDTGFGTAGRTSGSCASARSTSLIVTATRAITAGQCAGVGAGAGGPRMFAAAFETVDSAPAPSALSLTVETENTAPGVSMLPAEDIPVTALPFGAAGDEVAGTPLRSVDIASSPLRSVPLRSVPLRSVPLRSVPLRSVTLSQIPLRSVGESWEDILAGTPLAGVPLQNITLDQLLALEPPPAGLAAISLEDVDLGSTPLRSVSMVSIALGSTPLRSVPLRSVNASDSAAVFGEWCDLLGELGYSCADLGITADSPILALDLAGVPLRSVPLRSVPLRSVPLRSVDVNALPLRSVPLRSVRLDQIQLGGLPLSAIADAAEPALFTCTSCDQSRTLGQMYTDQLIKDTATLGDLFDAIDVAALPAEWDLLNLLQGLIDVTNYPWESLPVEEIGVQDFAGRSAPMLTYTASYRVTGTGDDDAVATVELPEGFRYVSRSTFQSGSEFSDDDDPTVTRTAGGTTLTFPARTVSGGTSESFTFQVRPSLRLHDAAPAALTVDIAGRSASTGPTAPVTVLEQFETSPPIFVEGDSFCVNCADYDIQGGFGGNNSPATGPVIGGNTLVLSHIGTPGDVDYFRLPVPPKGTRIQVRLGNQGGEGDFDAALLNGNAAAPLRSVPLRSVPLRSVPLADQGVDAAAADDAVSPDLLNDVPAGTASVPLRSVSVNRGSAEEIIDTTSNVDPAAGGYYTIQVTGYNGFSSAHGYTLYVREYAPPPPPVCPGARTFDHTGIPGVAPTVPADTNTLFLINQKRLGDTFGPDAAASVVSALDQLISAAPAGVQGVRYPVESSPAVQDALDAWDASPCSPELANTAFEAIGEVVDTVRTAAPGLANIVVVGGDDIMPMARVADYTQLSNESDYTESALDTNGAGNPVAAAVATQNILTDDPLGDFDPIPWLDHQLYVPDVAVGRLVESPAAIVAQLNLFVASGGQLDPATALTTGYDFLTDGADAVDAALAGAVPEPGNRQKLVNETWSRTDLNAALFPAAGAPDIADVNAHYDHNRALPALGNSTETEDDLFTVKDVNDAGTAVPRALLKRVLFTMGCHAGLNMPDGYLPAGDEAAPDWAQTYLGTGQQAAVYFANTGFGYGDTAAVALSEELMRLFAANLNGTMTVGQAAAFAKQAYFGQLGAYGPYDEKAMQEATFYGLPMYRIAGTGAPAPAPAAVVPVADADGILSASRTIAPTFVRKTSRAGGSFYTVNGEAQLSQYRPIVPRTSADITPANTGLQAHGYLMTDLESTDEAIVPAVARPVIDLTAAEPPPPAGDVVFPTTFTNLTTFNTPSGPEQRMVVLPGQVFRDASWGNAGAVQRLFTRIAGEVKYSNSTDFTQPFLTNVAATVSGTTLNLSLNATDAADVVRVVVLVKDESGTGEWQTIELVPSTGDPTLFTGTATIVGTQVEYFAQALDSAGNVGITTNKGRYFGALQQVNGPQPTPPTLVPVPGQPTGHGGWYDGPVGVELRNRQAGVVYDVTVDGQPASDAPTVSGDGAHLIVAKGSDGSAAQLVVAIDTTAPVIEAGFDRSPNARGWFNSPVGAHFTCTDPGPDPSGIASCPVPTVVSDEGETFTTFDVAGNSSTTPVNLDQTPPTVVLSGFEGATPDANGVYVFKLGAAPRPGCTASDARSGLDGPCTVTVEGGNANGVGTFTARAFATDNAGNTSQSPLVTYRVIYGFSGFLQPINDTGHTVTANTSIFKAGSTVPVKFHLRDASGKLVQAGSAPLWMAPVRTSSTTSQQVNESTLSAPEDSGFSFKWDGASQQYQYNWKTPKSPTGYYWRIAVGLDDGQIYQTYIGLR